MHKRIFYLLLIVILGLFYYMGFNILSINDKDKKDWQTLKSLGDVKETTTAESQQNKQGVRKEMWTPSASGRLHTKILSNSSQLRILRQDQKTQPIEELRGTLAFMQESVETDSQVVRVMKATDATFYFKEDRLVADNVQLYRFKLPGNKLPEAFPREKPSVEGEAKWVEFYLKEGKLDLNASQVVLKVEDSKEFKGGTLATDSLLFDGRLARLNGSVVVNHSLGKAVADNGEIILEKEGHSGLISSIILRKDVVLTRAEGAKILSQLADINFITKLANFKPLLFEDKGLKIKADQANANLAFDNREWKISDIDLIGNVSLFENGKGNLATDHKVRVLLDGKIIQKVFIEGPSVLSRIEAAKEKNHTVYIPGAAEIDHLSKITYLHRSKESQIHIVDPLGEIYADEAKILYTETESGLEMKKIYLEGKVFLAQILPSETERSYAYADRAEYDPLTHEVILEGDKDRVLVFDKINQVEVSAPRLKIRRDQVTKKETIQGEGDVRFRLDEQEFQALKNRFKLVEREKE